MKTDKIRERINALSKQMDADKSDKGQNAHLQDFVLWLLGYLDGCESCSNEGIFNYTWTYDPAKNPVHNWEVPSGEIPKKEEKKK